MPENENADRSPSFPGGRSPNIIWLKGNLAAAENAVYVMAVKKKKKILPLIALVLVLGVLAGAYVILSRMDLIKDEPLEETRRSPLSIKTHPMRSSFAYIKRNDSELSPSPANRERGTTTPTGIFRSIRRR